MSSPVHLRQIESCQVGLAEASCHHHESSPRSATNTKCCPSGSPEVLAQTREEGARRGLVVMATGLGKTYLASF